MKREFTKHFQFHHVNKSKFKLECSRKAFCLCYNVQTFPLISIAFDNIRLIELWLLIMRSVAWVYNVCQFWDQTFSLRSFPFVWRSTHFTIVSEFWHHNRLLLSVLLFHYNIPFFLLLTGLFDKELFTVASSLVNNYTSLKNSLD